VSKKLPRLTAGQITRILEKNGFILVRQSGSHKIYRNEKGARVTVPYHSGKTLHPKILRNILKDAELEAEDLRKLR
jgi:predicted RNA binding protein YcfA (HicA-like mRNA interferase family)